MSMLYRQFRRVAGALRRRLIFVYGSLLPGVWNLTSRCRYAGQSRRCLEIGPGQEHIEGFETMNIVPGTNVDYIGDASKRLPFKKDTFDLVYASHILEHIPWYQTIDTLMEWVRVIRPGGSLEIWVPDGLKICKVLIDAEKNQESTIPDEWCVRNPDKSPHIWVAGRLFWGANLNYPSWHRSLFTPRYLSQVMQKAGLQNIKILGSEEVRGHDHGWINLGMRGTKNA